MKRWKQILFRIFLFACLVVLFGPFLVPVPELQGLVTEADLAEPDSKFIEVNDVTVHYKEMGEGDSTFTWSTLFRMEVSFNLSLQT